MSNRGRSRPAQDLNSLRVLGQDGNWGIVWQEAQRDNGAESGLISCYFKNIEATLIDLVRAEPAEVLVGCIAWFTSPEPISALQEKTGVSLILDKSSQTEPALFSKMAGLSARICAALYPEADPGLFEESEKGMEPVRYVGFAASSERTHPLMHNKFLVFCRLANNKMVPYAVWTGSANFTRNARSSFENAVFIRDPAIATAYFNEWAQIVKFSEQSDLRESEPKYDFRLDYSGTTWPRQSRGISYLSETIYRVSSIVNEFLIDLKYDNEIPPHIYHDLSAKCEPMMSKVRSLAEDLSADLDTRFVSESEFNIRLGEINRLLKSLSDIDLVAKIEECLVGITRDLDQWGE